MKRLMLVLLAVGAMGLFSGAAVAEEAEEYRTDDGSASAPVGCAFGSCFGPTFGFPGDAVTYSGSGSVGTFADCCAAGTRFTLILENTATGAKAKAAYTSQGALDSSCTTGPHPSQVKLVLTGGANKATMKLVSSITGGGADGYLNLSGVWTQTSGVDSCGF